MGLRKIQGAQGSGICMGHGLKCLLHTASDLLFLAGLLGSHSPFMFLVCLISLRCAK